MTLEDVLINMIVLSSLGAVSYAIISIMPMRLIEKLADELFG